MTPLVQKFEQVVQRMQDSSGKPRYMHGHRLEIANMLSELDKTTSDKYPVVALRQDFEEVVSGGLVTYTLNLAIIEYTDKNYTAQERYVNVFVPVLYPLYSKLFMALRMSGFYWPNWLTYPPHTKIDRPFWGTAMSEKNVKQLFNDPIDAIEILNLKISTKTDCYGM